jgi:hypothetical protein
MLNAVALTVITLSGLYLLGLAALSLLAPTRAQRFLDAFASSARAHYLELSIRLAVGASLLVYAPKMRFAEWFHIAGWVLVITTLLLTAVPWRWHHRFAQRAVPYATRHPRLLGAASALLGTLVLASVASGARLNG